MTKKKVVPNRQYTTEFKIEAVRLAESIEGQSGGEAVRDTRFEYLELDEASSRRSAFGRCRDGEGRQTADGGVRSGG